MCDQIFLIASGLIWNLYFAVIAIAAGFFLATVLAIIALIYFVSRYYYDLNLTLLTKSIVMMVSGVLFLIAFALLRKKLNPR